MYFFASIKLLNKILQLNNNENNYKFLMIYLSKNVILIKYKGQKKKHKMKTKVI